MSTLPIPATTDPDPGGRRAGAGRVLANAILVLLAFEVASLVGALAQAFITGATIPPSPLEPVPLLVVVAGFLLVRWLVVLPALLVGLALIELMARRAPHPRALTTVVALIPMGWWELTQSGGDTSGGGPILGATGLLFAVLARLPGQAATRSLPAVGQSGRRTPRRRPPWMPRSSPS